MSSLVIQLAKRDEVYNLETKVDSVSKDVMFHEHFFPFHCNNDKNDALKQFFLLISSENLDDFDTYPTHRYQS